MRFEYNYKNSSGVRLNGQIDAESRNAAFEALRAKGIRPIKVVSLSGSKANGEERVITRKRFVFAALLIGLALGIGWPIAWSHMDMRDARIIAVDKTSRDMLCEHHNRMRLATADLVSSDEVLSNPSRYSSVRQAIADGYREIDRARNEVRDLFASAYAESAADAKSRDELHRELKSLYTAAMDSLELSEARHVKAEKAFQLLEKNMKKWHFSNGKIIVEDPDLRREIDYFRGNLPEEARSL